MSKAKIIADGVPSVTSFLQLSDTPASFSANYGVRVNSAGTALEYGMQSPRMQVTTQFSELNTTIPVTLGAFTIWKSLIRLDLDTSLAAGDKLIVLTELELRNDYSINCEVATNLFITNTATPNDGDDLPVDGYFLSPITGHNVDNITHYYNTPKSGSLIVPAAMATPRIFLRGRCRSSDATGTQTFNIMSGYHKITCMVFPKNGL